MNQEYNNMAHKPIFPLLMKMAIPPMISMLIQSMYNIIDSIFVAKLGEKALTALSLAFPLQNLSLAFSKLAFLCSSRNCSIFLCYS